MSGSQTTAAEEFHFFPLLPPEIRLCIWDYNLPGPRVVPIRLGAGPSYPLLPHQDQGAVGCTSNATIPINLHVCRESREAASRVYGPRFRVSGPGGDKGEGRVFFDYRQDVLYFGTRDGDGASSAQLTSFLSTAASSELANVRYVAVNNEVLAISSPAACPDQGREGGAHHRHVHGQRGGTWSPTREAASRNSSGSTNPENHLGAEPACYLPGTTSSPSSPPVSPVFSSSWSSSLSSGRPSSSRSSDSRVTSPYIVQPPSPTATVPSAPICCCCCSTAGGGGGGPGGLPVETALAQLACSFPRLAHLSFVFKDRNPIYSSDVKLVSSSSRIIPSTFEPTARPPSSYCRTTESNSVGSQPSWGKGDETKEKGQPTSQPFHNRRSRCDGESRRTVPLVQDRIAERAIRKAIRQLEEEQKAGKDRGLQRRCLHGEQASDHFGSEAPRLWLQGGDGEVERETRELICCYPQKTSCSQRLVTWDIEFLVAAPPPSAVAGFERAMIGWGRDAAEAKRERARLAWEWVEGQRRE